MTNESTAPQTRLLLVDDDEVFRERLAKALRARALNVDTADSAAAAMLIIKRTKLDMAVVVLRMPKGTGLDVVQASAVAQPQARILVLTGYGSISTAIEATRLGATAYLAKPADAEDIRARCVQKLSLPHNPLICLMKVMGRQRLPGCSGSTSTECCPTATTIFRKRRAVLAFTAGRCQEKSRSTRPSVSFL